MICKKVSKDMSGFSEIALLQKESFPPEENYSMEQLLELAESDHIEYQSFWENDILCGILFYNVGFSMIYLFYLAVNPVLRSKGYGSEILQWLKRNYPNKVIVANIEPVEILANNAEQRRRRLTFYEKNGFQWLPYRVSDDSGLYDIISTDNTFEEKEYMELIMELGFAVYNPKLLKL